MTERQYDIGVLAGDGVGPEVVAEALKVLERLQDLFGFRCRLRTYPWSGQYYLDTGELMPESAIDEFKQLDALLLGAVGDPRVERGLIEHSIVLKVRIALDLYINLRPIVLYADHLTPLKGVTATDVDMVVVRENTEDVYVGPGGSLASGTQREIAVAAMIFTHHGVERAIRYAFELAQTRGNKKRLTLVDKSNAIRPQEIWRRVLAEVGEEYPDVETQGLYVDAAVMHMVSNPAQFDVIVTTNLFGDIITDLGAAIQGGLGSAASGNIHPGRVSMFEPIHGSAPDIAGQGIASPVGAIAALAMMLDYLGEGSAAGSLQETVRELLVSRTIPSLDARSGLSTSAVGNLVVDRLTQAGG